MSASFILPPAERERLLAIGLPIKQDEHLRPDTPLSAHAGEARERGRIIA